MSTKEIKKIIVDWAIDCDISPEEFEWGEQWKGLMETTLYITFNVKNNCMLTEELQSLEKRTQANFVCVSANNDMLNIMIRVNYEDD